MKTFSIFCLNGFSVQIFSQYSLGSCRPPPPTWQVRHHPLTNPLMIDFISSTLVLKEPSSELRGSVGWDRTFIASQPRFVSCRTLYVRTAFTFYHFRLPSTASATRSLLYIYQFTEKATKTGRISKTRIFIIIS